MLQLTNIRKAYTTGTFTQVALDDVSIAFRDNEFVAILGPSGSGKTTMLNIIGGLDHYDSGDLAIDGVSTKQYKDRDWDTYRNNSIGFVFQSYNLIPHQTVLANVELALTLSGVGKAERTQRAREALAKVGLADHVNKKPSQLSGGQMQRVAIARALINDPDILLADEPTGALDSKTSVQIMDLLTEIAADRLVIMVTHNPELAEQYANRIVNLRDGVIESDTNPFIPTAAQTQEGAAKPLRHTSMSFLTALGLSANNLMTKIGRTIMTAFAGSIGIIGIAAILALANGVQNYINNVEEETLSVYPLQILSTGFNMTSMLVGQAAGSNDSQADAASEQAEANSATGAAGSGSSGSSSSGSAGGSSGSNSSSSSTNSWEVPEGKIGENKMMTRMFASIGSNDLAALKAYLDSGESGIEDYVNAIYYEYAVTPQIFAADTTDGVRQVNPDKSFSSLGIGSGSSTNSLVSMSMSTDMFNEMMKDNPIVENTYEVLAGHWPEKPNELVLVLTSTSRMSDFLYYIMGLRDYDELKDMIRQFTNEEDVVVPEDRMLVDYDDVLGMTFKLVNAADFYQYDSAYGVWVDKSSDEAYMKDLVNNGEDLVIAGIVRPKEGANALSLSSGIYYTEDLTNYLIEQAEQSQIVRDQLADPQKDVLSGKRFDELDDGESAFDMGSLFTIDTGALSSAFTFNSEALNVDMSGLDLSGLDMSSMDIPPFDPSGISLDPSVLAGMTPEEIAALFPELTAEDIGEALVNVDVSFTDGGQAYAQALQAAYPAYLAWQASGHPDATMQEFFQTDEGAPYRDALTAAIASTLDTDRLVDSIAEPLAEKLGKDTADEAEQEIVNRVATAIAAKITAALQQQIAVAMQQYMAQVMTAYTQAIQAQLGQAMQGVSTQLAQNMQNAMGFDPSAFSQAFQFNMDSTQLSELMLSMMRTEEHSFDNNLKKLGYADFDKPNQISIYPRDFESKSSVLQIIDDYNARMRATDEEKVVSYTDIVGTLMTSVTDIINMITAVLIAFVAISLVVSSIMIGIITYISVLERKKEIGILRAIGASKRDISRVFNAETFIVGFIAGLIGVVVTALLCIPANMIIYSIYQVENVALLPIGAAVILIGISVVLTLIAGLLPSGKAARQDPVEALRSE